MFAYHWGGGGGKNIIFRWEGGTNLAFGPIYKPLKLSSKHSSKYKELSATSTHKVTRLQGSKH
jgi:hypothetical protein